MESLIISIRDIKTNYFGSISLSPNVNVARRTTSLVVNDSANKILNKYPEDFELWIVGTFDDDKGVISTEKKEICSLLELKEDNHE
jgi:hypothetical protein